MRPALIIILFSFLALAAPPRTMRVDYYHTAGPAEVFALDRVVREPLPWPGSLTRLLDDTNLGLYRFEVVDRGSNRIIFSRGFASICGEWETTGEAKKMARTFQESLRFPAPDAPVQVVLKKRDAQNAFREIWSFLLDPKDVFIQTAPAPQQGTLIELQKSGDPSEKVDFLILGDGYTEKELPKFEKDARRMAEALFQESPFKEHRADFNVWALCPPADASGISRPSTGVQRRSPLGSTYDAFGSERYILTFENKAWRDVAAWAPYEFVEILANGETYGGGGIFGLYGTVAVDNAYAPYVFVHEFGHHIAGLADEYYTSDVAYAPGKERLEPWELNVSADPKRPKWAALLSPDVPLPTPWRKKAFEDYSYTVKAKRRQIRAENRPEAEMNAHFKAEEEFETRLLGTDEHSGKVGAFEGANYEATGYFRSQEDCIMFTRDKVPFCAACQAAIKRVIRLYTR